VLGIWLIIAPFLLGYSHLAVATWNDIILGVLVAGTALLLKSGISGGGASWTNIVFGIWLILAPFILNYGNNPAPRWNDIILGVLVIVFGWSSAAVPEPPPKV